MSSLEIQKVSTKMVNFIEMNEGSITLIRQFLDIFSVCVWHTNESHPMNRTRSWGITWLWGNLCSDGGEKRVRNGDTGAPQTQVPGEGHGVTALGPWAPGADCGRTPPPPRSPAVMTEH